MGIVLEIHSPTLLQARASRRQVVRHLPFQEQSSDSQGPSASTSAAWWPHHGTAFKGFLKLGTRTPEQWEQMSAAAGAEHAMSNVFYKAAKEPNVQAGICIKKFRKRPCKVAGSLGTKMLRIFGTYLDWTYWTIPTFAIQLGFRLVGFAQEP